MSKARGRFAKICHTEGVVFEKEYSSGAEAAAFIDGCNGVLEALDIDLDDYFFCVDDKPAEDDGSDEYVEEYF